MFIFITKRKESFQYYLFDYKYYFIEKYFYFNVRCKNFYDIYFFASDVNSK